MLTRRQMLQRVGTGLGVVGLASVLNEQSLLGDQTPSGASSPLAPRPGHFAPKAKRVIHLFMNGGPSQVDTFDPKPQLARYHGQRPPGANRSTERGTSGRGCAEPTSFGLTSVFSALPGDHRPW